MVRFTLFSCHLFADLDISQSLTVGPAILRALGCRAHRLPSSAYVAGSRSCDYTLLI